MEPLLLAILLLLAPPLAWLAAFALQPRKRWRYRHIPGPLGWPLVGNLPGLVRHGQHAFFAQCERKYGPVFKIWMGPTVFVIVAGAEESKLALSKLLARPVSNPTGGLLDQETTGSVEFSLLFASGPLWRRLRTIWAPAFAPDALARCAPTMSRLAEALTERLAAAAEGGARPVEVYWEMGRHTTRVVGKAAYGVDLDGPTVATVAARVMPDQSLLLRPHGPPLPAAVRAAGGAHAAEPDMSPLGRMWRATQEITQYINLAHNAGMWQLVNTCIPRNRWVWAAARACPDGALKNQIQARALIKTAAQNLLERRKAIKAGCPQAELAKALMDGSWEGETARVAALTDEEVEAEAAIDREEASAVQRGAGEDDDDGGSGAAQLRQRRGMRLGRFLSVLSPARLEAANGASGASGKGGSRGAEPLAEYLQLAQTQLFFLAGSDTTASALSYLTYCLAKHPAAQSEVQAELDAWRQADAPTATQLRDGFPKLNAAISEALRLYPSLPAPGRVGDCAVTLRGLAVPAGTPLRVSTYALHRSTRVWGPDAAEFRLERWAPGGQGEAVEKAGGYVPFGGGPRRCPGYKFALQLVRLTAWQLLRCFRLELLPGQEELHTSSGVTMAPTHGVHVRLHPR